MRPLTKGGISVRFTLRPSLLRFTDERMGNESVGSLSGLLHT